MNHPPLEIAFWIGDYLQLEHDRDCLNTYQLSAMLKLLDTMVDVLGTCERILKTPIPLGYSIHLKQVLLIYCLSLPFQMVNDLSLWTGLVVGLISFAVFGYEFLRFTLRKSSHAVYCIHLHIVLVTKYRRKVITSEILLRMYSKNISSGKIVQNPLHRPCLG